MIGIWCDARSLETVDLPEAIPPVNPTTRQNQTGLSWWTAELKIRDVLSMTGMVGIPCKEMYRDMYVEGDVSTGRIRGGTFP